MLNNGASIPAFENEIQKPLCDVAENTNLDQFFL
jgi:hypothetical protein